MDRDIITKKHKGTKAAIPPVFKQPERNLDINKIPSSANVTQAINN